MAHDVVVLRLDRGLNVSLVQSRPREVDAVRLGPFDEVLSADRDRHTLEGIHCIVGVFPGVFGDVLARPGRTAWWDGVGHCRESTRSQTRLVEHGTLVLLRGPLLLLGVFRGDLSASRHLPYTSYGFRRSSISRAN